MSRWKIVEGLELKSMPYHAMHDSSCVCSAVSCTCLAAEGLLQLKRPVKISF